MSSSSIGRAAYGEVVPTTPPRRTKIVATIGPACESNVEMRALLDAGMDVARLGLAHGPIEDHVDRLQRLRAVAAGAGRTLGVLADLPGPKVRAGELPEDGVVLVEEDRVLLVADDGPSTATRIAV